MPLAPVEDAQMKRRIFGPETEYGTTRTRRGEFVPSPEALGSPLLEETHPSRRLSNTGRPVVYAMFPAMVQADLARPVDVSGSRHGAISPQAALGSMTSTSL